MSKSSSMLLILLAAIFWGTTGTSQAFAPEDAHPIAIGAVRLAVGGLFLLCLVLFKGTLTLRDWPLRTILLAAVSMAAYQPLFFSAVLMTGVAVGTVVAIGARRSFRLYRVAVPKETSSVAVVGIDRTIDHRLSVAPEQSRNSCD